MKIEVSVENLTLANQAETWPDGIETVFMWTEVKREGVTA